MNTTYRILTEYEWELLAIQEDLLYDAQGPYSFTGIRDRHDSSGLAMLWDDAMASLDMFIEDDTRCQVMAAERVAKAQYHIITGDAVQPNILWERAVSGEALS